MNFNHIFLRLLSCLIGWGTVGIVYNFTGKISDHATLLSPSWVDNTVAYSTNAIWVYLSFFLFIPFGYLFSAYHRIRSLMLAMIVCALVSGAVYLIYPTTMHYPFIECISLSERALCDLISVDSPQNLLPSLHVSLTLVMLSALWSQHHKFRTTLYLLWAAAICFSVLVLKRHLFIDVVTGAITAIAALYIARWIQNRLPHGESASE
ncbi:phosphatase PAP2 family protein [Providencia manganoxydans]|uniref:phosphatase PAP2 family protein n=1 Tax=Providencia manganoxydans TaxID=2923283 RepID=UPI0032DA331B